MGHDFEQVADQLVARFDDETLGFDLAVDEDAWVADECVYVTIEEVRPLVEWLKRTFPRQFVDTSDTGAKPVVEKRYHLRQDVPDSQRGLGSAMRPMSVTVSRESLEQYASTLRADLAAIERVLERFG